MSRIYLLLCCITLTACTPSEQDIQKLVQRHLEEMVFVEGGSFMMGNPGGWDTSPNSWPPHKVTLDSFYIQKYEVTNRDFDLFRKATGYVSSSPRYKGFYQENKPHFAPKLPAIASWRDAKAFCQWLGQQTGKSIDLPTEAQWEYAARSRGQMLRYATHDGEARAGVNMLPKAKDGFTNREALPLLPGSFPPNPLGLYDMSGNAREWVHDNYQPDYYEHSPEHNPQGPEIGKPSLTQGMQLKVARGGNIYDFMGNTTVTRAHLSEHFVFAAVSFRCAMATP